MSKFNRKSSGTKTVNLAGGEAFKETPKLEFVSILLTSFLKDKFYETENETMKRVINLIDTIKDKKFVAKAGIYARTKFGMRSVSHLVAGQIAKIVKGEDWTKRFFDKVVYRVDDITEILSFYLFTYGKPIPNSLKKGLNQALGRFDEYAIAKYRGENSELSLVDAVNLIHPKPTEKNKVALEKLVKGTLKSKDTWEIELTQAGQKAKTEEEKTELKKQSWVKLIKEKKIKYFALLRNLRNIIEQAPEVLDEALKILVDEKLINESLVLPFRYSTAYNEIEQMSSTQKVLKAISKAIDISLQNVPKFEGDTLVVLDCSGSMAGQPAQIGSLFTSILVKTNDADLILFSDMAKYKTVNSMDSTLTIANSINFATGGTNFHAIFETANKKYDRIIILSDMQGWIGGNAPVKTFNKYKERTNANPIIYSFDLNGYGTLQFPERNIYCLAGFSEKIFDIMKFLETDKEALIHEIEKIEL